MTAEAVKIIGLIRENPMKVRARLSGLTLLIGALLQPNSKIHAQDVAAAARANRARHESMASEKPDSAWYSPTSASIHAQDKDAEVTILYEIDANQDLRITMNGVEKRKKQAGTMMVINGKTQWMLAKNMPLEKGFEIDPLDGAVLNLRLVLELLRAAAPGGPTTVSERATFDVKEDNRSIAVSTASASGGLEAPWSLHATIEPIAAGQWSFDLSAKHSRAIHMTGTWQKEDVPPTFDDQMPLDGWQILSIGPIKTTDGNSTILDYGAQISEKHPKTLGELRKMSPRQE
jgi:hypothetical protein